MEVQINVKIKIGKGKEVTLSNTEARALYNQLKEIYESPVSPWVIYPWRWEWPYTYYPVTLSGDSTTIGYDKAV